MMAVQKQSPYCVLAICVTPCFIIGFSIFLYALLHNPGQARWTSDQAWRWYRGPQWMVGCNYINRDAVNTLEMWGSDFNATQIDEELGWAQTKLQMNTIRVFLHYALYQQNSTEFLGKLDQLLSIAEKHKMKTIFVLFDDVWNPEFNITGKQPDPLPFVHNSRWVQCPGKELLFNDSKWDQSLKPYTTGIINRYKSDPRVLMWDLYNEPGNFNRDLNETDEKLKHSLDLLKSVFDWAHSCDPSQPLTSGVWTSDNTTGAKDIRQFQLDHADVITFHNYDPLEGLIDTYRTLKAATRYPLICTEYMARTAGSRFETSLPFMKAYGIGAINWGLVSGKTNTIYPWDSWSYHYDGTERNLTEWFHDVLHQDGTVYKKSEQDIITSLIELSSDSC